MRYLDIDTGKKISKIGLGTWQFGSKEWGYGELYTERAAYATVRRALELGVTLFDTAEIYGSGRSERILGRALGENRESVFLATKIFPIVPGAPLATAILGASSVEQLESNVAAAEIELSNDEYQALQTASAPFCPAATLDASRRRNLSQMRHSAKFALKHSVKGAWYLSKTEWHDYKREHISVNDPGAKNSSVAIVRSDAHLGNGTGPSTRDT